MDGPRVAQRRLVTCLFLDIVGSTELVMIHGLSELIAYRRSEAPRE